MVSVMPRLPDSRLMIKDEGLFRVYTGEELMNLDMPKREFLIDRYIRERDSVMLVGDEKSGKSILAFQMMCSMTSGHPFLDKFNVPRELRVVYVQMEGEIEDTYDRLQRMTQIVDIEPSNFLMYYTGNLSLDDPNEVIPFADMFREFNPDIIIIDPIYFALSGDLNDNLAVRAFTSNLRAIKNKLDCAIMLVHHTHRLRHNIKGDILQEGDEAIYGSKFFKAWADHILFFVYDKKNVKRVLSCSTQRSGNIHENVHMKLIQPEPLYFEEIDQNPAREAVVLDAIARSNNNGLNMAELKANTGLAESTLYQSIALLVKEKVVCKTKTRPVRYGLKARGHGAGKKDPPEN